MKEILTENIQLGGNLALDTSVLVEYFLGSSLGFVINIEVQITYFRA